MIPLILKLKKESHKRVAAAQDIIVKTLYSVFNDAVLHGGTAIWRCYKGNRFSEDVDVYFDRDLEKVNLFFNKLEKEGFVIQKKKVGKNSIYSNLLFNRDSVRFEALFKKVDGTLKEYEAVEGNLITVFTLTPEQFLQEKVDAYLNRFKVRDIYDIFFMLRYIDDKSKIKNIIKDFLCNFKNPVDEKDLKVLILEGLVPSVEKMLDYIRRNG